MYAVIDIGSNTIRLSFYKKKGGKLESVMNKKEVAGLASYVDEKNNLNEEGVATLIYVLNEFKQIVKGLKPSNVYVLRLLL